MAMATFHVKQCSKRCRLAVTLSDPHRLSVSRFFHGWYLRLPGVCRCRHRFLAIPGPGNLALLTATAAGGRKGGISATFGVIAGDQVLMWAAVAGLAALLTASPVWFAAMQWLGALYLAYLGIQMWRKNPADAPILDMLSGHFFRQTFFITLLNPKAIVFYMAFFPLFIDVQQQPGVLTFAVMATTVAALTFLYGFGLRLVLQK